MKRVLLLLAAVAGTILTWTVMGLYLVSSNFDFAGLMAQTVASPGALFIALDLGVTGLVLVFWMLFEPSPPKGRWIPLVLVFAVGICAALPVWLLLKDRQSIGCPQSAPCGRK